jgi:hypothetical protein
MSLNRRRFVDWIERRMLSVGDRPASFHLCHLGRSGGHSLVCKLEPVAEAPADDIAHALAEQIEAEAIDHVEAWPGRQQYVMRAYTEAGHDAGEFAFFQTANHISHTHTHAVGGITELTPEQAAFAGGNMAQPELLGHPLAMVASQGMRHAEGLVRFMVEQSAMNRERDAQIIKQQQAMIDKMQGRQTKMMDLVETMSSRQAERELAEQSYNDDKDRKDKLLDRLTTLVLPALAERAGVPTALLGADGGVDINEIREIFLKLPDEMQDSIVGTLSEKDQATLLSIFKRKTETAPDTKH